MSENQTVESGNNPAQEGERTFSQDELNKIVADRLSKEKAKADAALAAKEQEIVKRELDFHVTTTLSSKELPTYLLDAIRAEDKASFDKSVEAVEKYAKEYAAARFLKGETPKAGGSQPPQQDTIRQGMGLK